MKLICIIDSVENSLYMRKSTGRIRFYGSEVFVKNTMPDESHLSHWAAISTPRNDENVLFLDS